jgi:hypothetical protein
MVRVAETKRDGSGAFLRRDNGGADVRTIFDTPYRVAVVARLYCIGLIQPRDSFGLSSL